MPQPLDQLSRAATFGVDWLSALPLPLQVVAAAVGLAVLWVLWILLRVILVALRATFRGL